VHADNSRSMGGSPAGPPGASTAITRRRWVALVVLCFGQLMIVLDTTIVQVALPSIQRDLHFSSASLAWVINAYLVTFAGFLLLAGRLGDLMGRKRVFITGLVMFTAASALCGASQSAAMLVAARLLQGVAAATTTAVILAIIAASFDGRQRTQAIGIATFTAIAGASLGLLVGGGLTQALGWHWIFFVNVPIGIIVLPLAQLFIEPHEGIGFGDAIDWLGAVLITASLMIGSYAIVEASNHGWASFVTLGGGAVALVLVALFILREQSTPHPLVQLRIFRSRNVSGANVGGALLIFGWFAALFLLSLYMQNVLHYGSLHTGLAFMPMTCVSAVCTLAISSRLINLVGPKRTLLLGLLLLVAGLVAFAQLPANATYVDDLLPGLVLIGAAGPLVSNPALILAIAGVPPADFGVASGMTNVSRQVGAAIGLALVASLSATRARSLLAAGHSAASATVGGDHLAFTVVALTVAAGFVFSALVLRRHQGSNIAADHAGADGNAQAAA